MELLEMCSRALHWERVPQDPTQIWQDWAGLRLLWAGLGCHGRDKFVCKMKDAFEIVDKMKGDY